MWEWRSNYAICQIALIAIASFSFSQTCRGETDSRESILPPRWDPDPFLTIDYLERQLSNAPGQQEMNQLSAKIAELKDAQLLIVYVRLMERLGLEQRKALLLEQRNWLDKREKHVAKSVKSVGGTTAPLEANRANIEFTEKRISELRDKLKQIQKSQKMDPHPDQ
jgi:uncharacterized protein YecT (DUF1311 family)